MIAGILKKNKLLSVVVLIYVFLFFTMPDKAYLSIRNSMYYIVEMIKIMPVIFVLTSIIEVWIPKKMIIDGFGEKSGVKGTVFSFLLGSFSAGPVYAAFPVCKMLLKKGASIENVVIILSAWAVIKVPMLANEAKFLGLHFMGIRWLLTVAAIWMISHLVALLVKRESVPIEKEKDFREATDIEIKEAHCIGCGLCEKLLPQHFQIVNKKAKWRESTLDNNNQDKLEVMMDKCPVKAIGFR